MKEEQEVVLQLETLDRLGKDQLQTAIDNYGKSANMEGYAKIALIVFPVLFLIHNVFLAGRTYDMDTYDFIMNTEMSIIGIIVFIIIVLAIRAWHFKSVTKDILNEEAKRKKINKTKLQEEFSILAVHYYGGEGVKLV